MSDSVESMPKPRSAVSDGVRFYGIWLAAAVALLVLPRIFPSGGALTTLSLIGIAIIFALSYNILLGQTGMLSFGHAVYYGFGGFLAVHGMNLIAASRWPIPLPLVPLIGGVAGLAFALALGWVSTKRSGTAFAMISLGVAELVGASVLILRSFFGGEAGITANRTRLFRLFDWSFGPQIQIYYLIAAWTLIATIAMYALTRTPWGRMCNAVRDNPERVQFVGYDPHVIRYIAFCFAGFFGGIAGALTAINFEIANSAYLGAVQSGTVLFAAYIGGIGYFIGPILGAIFVTYLSLTLSDLTSVWQLYFGLIFIAVVVFAPGGLAGLLMKHRPVMRAGALAPVLRSYLVALPPTVAMLAGLVLAIEITVHYTVNAADDPHIRAFGMSFDASSPIIWALAAALIVLGYLVARRTWAHVANVWDKATTAAREQGFLA
jgi:branched-chain amino acid transport system permease protein